MKTIDEQKILKTSQEQAVAAWAETVHAMRVNELIEHLSQQDLNLIAALHELSKVKNFVATPEHILGSPIQKHGEVAEHLHVRFMNAEFVVKGGEYHYEIDSVPRLAMEDYLHDGKMVQSKFCQDVGNTFKAIKGHFETYPNFIKDGGTYDIPKDQHAQLINILRQGDKRRSYLSSHDESIYKSVRAWEKENGINIENVVNPSATTYKDAQLGVVNSTIDSEESKVRALDNEQRSVLKEEYAPSMHEAIKVAATSAAIDGVFSFALKIYEKRKSGKKLYEFTEEDWKDIGVETADGVVKGGIRGGILYATTNYTQIPTPVASALVTASLGVAAQARKLERGYISKDEFLMNSEAICMDTTASALFSTLGSVLIPIPILGTVIGNAAGMFMYDIAINYLNDLEQKYIIEYENETNALIAAWDQEYAEIRDVLNASLGKYNSMAELAFDEDINVRFNSSIDIARFVGVDDSRIIKNQEEGDAFFLV